MVDARDRCMTPGCKREPMLIIKSERGMCKKCWEKKCEREEREWRRNRDG